VASDGRLRFGVIGTGSIAVEFVDALASSRSCAAVAVASRDAGPRGGLRAASRCGRELRRLLDPVERTDRYAMAILRFDGDVLAQLSCAVTLTQDDHVRIYGTQGHLHVPLPCWLGERRDAASQIILTRPGAEPEAIDVPGGANIFAPGARPSPSRALTRLPADHQEAPRRWVAWKTTTAGSTTTCPS
jgi:predicted dehydrogenase